MSSGVKKFILGAAIVGAMFIPGVNAFLGPTIVAGITSLGAGLAASGLAEIYYTEEVAEGLKANVTATQATIPIVYGYARVGLRLVDVRTVDSTDPDTPSASPAILFPIVTVTSGGLSLDIPAAGNDDILILVGAFCVGSEDGSGIEDITKVRFNRVNAPAINNPDIQTNISTASINSRYLPTIHSTSVPYLKYLIRDGRDAQAVPTELVDHLGWPSTSDGAGIAYIALFMRWEEGVWAEGLPEVTALIKGRKVYDPRSSTWAWSENPALCILDYLTSKRVGGRRFYPERDGGDVSLSEIDEQSFIDAANYCDASVNWGSGSQPRFVINCGIDPSRPTEDNLADMLSSCRGEIVYQSGKYKLVIRQAVTPEALELTTDNIIGEWSIDILGSSVPNRIEAAFYDSRNDDFVASPVIWPLSSDSTFLNQDNGQENKLDISLPCTPNYYQALQTIMVMLREMRQNVIVGVTCTEECAQYQVGEVVRLTHETPGWVQKEFWVIGIDILPEARVRLNLREYDAAAYSLDSLSARATLPGSNLPNSLTIGAPSGLTFVSDATTVQVVQGSVIPRVLLSWTPPADSTFLDHYDIRMKLNSEAVTLWRSVATAFREDDQIYIAGVVEGLRYDVEIRAVNTLGKHSDWVQLINQLVSKTESIEELSENPGFELGDRNWTKQAGWAIGNDAATARRGNWRAVIAPNLVPTDDVVGGWTHIGPPVITSGIDDPFGGADAYRIADTIGSQRYIRLAIPYTGNGSKILTFVVREVPGGTPAGGHAVECFDASAISARGRLVWDGWTDGEPTGVLAQDGATYLGAWYVGGGWWALDMLANGVIATNTNQARVYPAYEAIESGELDFFVVNSFNSTTRLFAIMVAGGTGSAALRNHRESLIDAGRQYLIEGWMRGDGGADGTASPRVSWLDASRAEISVSYAVPAGLISDGAYHKGEAVVVSPANAVFARAEFAVLSHSDGIWYADDIRLTRKPEVAGQSDNTDAVDDAPSNEVARTVQSGTVMGPDADGEVDVTFLLAYNATPVITIKEYRVKSFDAGLGTGSDQTLVLEATNVDPSGFTLRAVLVGGVPTLVADGDDFVASSDLDVVGETVECNLASLPAGGAYGDAYTVHYSVALQVTATPSGDPFFRTTVVVAIDTNDGGGWIERETRSYQVTSLGGASSISISDAAVVVNVSGLGTNDDIRIRIKSITEVGSGTIDNLNVHGFNVATNGDASEGVTWQEETVGASEVSAIDDASHFVRWEAKNAT